ncbi:MAG: homoserine dehydrogenase [Fibromonadaceae bacterium]|jgi:homoserine dehydrogenase|nr:homoserine dehydrogenase [Fibromonadaceae bacterium]
MRIGIIGVGTVGSGVVEIIEQKRHEFHAKFGVLLEIAAVVAKTENELEPFKEKGYKGFTDASVVLEDDSISVICELAGGYELPFKWISKALENGKHVVTANKALLAKHGSEIFPLAEQKKCHILFEAAVGGGIPIIRSLQESLLGNSIESLSCIINGTCNYILTRMSAEGLSFEEVLADAQKLGFAEADPSFDVDGIDAAHKTAILASLCSGRFVDFEKIHITGIKDISATDIQFIQELGGVVRLLGLYRRVSDKVDARVHPCIVPNEHLLASVKYVLNAVYLQCDNLGPTLQTGAGAGKLPTASAVVADLVSLARSIESGHREPLPMCWFQKENSANLVSIGETCTRYYFRFVTKDNYGVLAKITGILGENKISIESILQKSIKNKEKVDIVVTTEKARESSVQAALAKIDALPEISEKSKMLRFLE